MSAVKVYNSVTSWDAEVVAMRWSSRIGQLKLVRATDDDLSAECLRALGRLRKSERDDTISALVVDNAWLDEHERGKGIGASLYVEAARVARYRFHAALAPHRCVHGGSTSSDAQRVWESERFYGNVEFYEPLAWSTGMPDFDDPNEYKLNREVMARRHKK